MTGRATGARVVMVGAGMLGRPLAAALRRQGVDVLSVARAEAPGSHLRADLGTPAGRALLAGALADRPPDRVVLAHGPSDVSLIERAEPAAAEVHAGTARLAAGYPVLLVSTDNVFPGTAGRCRVGDPVRPANAYGRVKRAAERALPAATVVRVSLVYGGSTGRLDYVRRCLAEAATSRTVAAPVDQRLTPVYVEDAVDVLVALVLAPARAATLHLAGPTELSRYELARLAYRAAGADPGLVRPVRRAETEWACRPAFSSLAGSDLPGPVPRDPAAGVAALLAGSRP